MGPRSRLPLSPSMEARLSDDTSASQDSLVSTGSNQELQTQLDTTLAEVEAITKQLEKQKLPMNDEQQKTSISQPSSTIEVNTSTSPTQQQQAPPKPRRLSKDCLDNQSQQRRSSQQSDQQGPRKTSEGTGARNRNPVKKYSNGNPLQRTLETASSVPNMENLPKVTPRSNVPVKNEANSSTSSKPLLITQGSWASRDEGMNFKSAAASAKVLRNKRSTSPKPKQSFASSNDTQDTNDNERNETMVGRAQVSYAEARKASLSSQHVDDPNNGDIRKVSSSRSLWEKRASSQGTTSAFNALEQNNQSHPTSNMSASVEGAQHIGGAGSVGPNPVSVAFQLQRGGFRNNRDFWEQRGATRQKQTPDLVIDLPVSSLSTSPNRAQSSSPPSSASSASGSSANTATVAPLPRPRKSISPSNNPLANIDPEDKETTRRNAGKPSAKPRKL